jgi:hypothetical protein
MKHLVLFSMVVATSLFVRQPACPRNSIDVVVHGHDAKTIREYGDLLRLELNDDAHARARAFLAPRVWLFLELEQLRVLQTDIDRRWDWEVARASGFTIEDGPPPPMDTQRIVLSLRERFERATNEIFTSPDGLSLVVPRATERGRDAALWIQSDPRFGLVQLDILPASQSSAAKKTAADARAVIADDRALFRRVPADQAEKIPIVLAIGNHIQRAHERGIITDTNWAKIGPFVPPADLAPLAERDLVF